MFPIRLQKNYRQHINQVKYSPVTDTPEIILARKNAQLVSKVSKLHDDIIHYQGLITITRLYQHFSAAHCTYEH